MSVHDFDTAVIKKFQKLYSNTSGSITDPDLAFQVRYGTNDNKGTDLKFPFVAISRPSGFDRNSVQVDKLRIGGVNYTYDSKVPQAVNGLELTLTYQVDIYSNTHEELERFVCELMYALELIPSVVVTQYPSNPKSPFEPYVDTFSLLFTSGVDNVSVIDDQVGHLYRYTLSYSISQARVVFWTKSPLIEDYSIEVGISGVPELVRLRDDLDSTPPEEETPPEEVDPNPELKLPSYRMFDFTSNNLENIQLSKIATLVFMNAHVVGNNLSGLGISMAYGLSTGCIDEVGSLRFGSYSSAQSYLEIPLPPGYLFDSCRILARNYSVFDSSTNTFSCDTQIAYISISPINIKELTLPDNFSNPSLRASAVSLRVDCLTPLSTLTFNTKYGSHGAIDIYKIELWDSRELNS